MARRAYLDDEGRLQIRLQTNPSQSSHSHEVLHSIDDLLLVALRMTFGGAPNPSQWSDVSEMITDLANDLVRRDDWDPSVYHSPHQHLLDTEGQWTMTKGRSTK
ncbi:hypothetical protein MHU86_12930 [Fragilaria crotonensis]|nr:hypothetical protein MHU86_12930 [Fragilaria crotonensis]